jgi:hypothetical protein
MSIHRMTVEWCLLRYMHRQILHLMFAVTVCSGSLTFEAQQPFVHGSDVAFTVWTDQTRYSMRKPIVVHYAVKNLSNGALFVPKSQWDIRCGGPPHFWARLEDTSGKHHEPGYGGSCLGPSPVDRMIIVQRMRKDAVLLKPGQSARGSFTFHPEVFRDLNAGTYRLEAVMYGWNLGFSESELTQLSGMGAPFLIGETHATTHIELQAASETLAH